MDSTISLLLSYLASSAPGSQPTHIIEAPLLKHVKACSQSILVSLCHVLMSPTQPVFTPIHVAVNLRLRFLPRIPSLIIQTNYSDLENSMPFVISLASQSEHLFLSMSHHASGKTPRGSLTLRSPGSSHLRHEYPHIEAAGSWLDISVSLDSSLLWLARRDVSSESPRPIIRHYSPVQLRSFRFQVPYKRNERRS